MTPRRAGRANLAEISDKGLRSGMSNVETGAGPGVFRDDPVGAFCVENDISCEPDGDGPLSGLSFAVKDVFDIAGSRTGFGHPEWLRTHPPATTTAPTVRRLLEAGAAMVGKTISDELCYSLTGVNVHYGTPVNPWAPDRVPGGSSNGSASAVAGGLVDFALGTDCGGSVRLPSAYCGIFGIRPTHDRVSLDCCAPFAPSFDCAGWMARDPALLNSVGRILLGEDETPARPGKIIILSDAFELADADLVEALSGEVERIAGTFSRRDEAVLSPDGLDGWFETFRILQAREIWQSLGDWVRDRRPKFGPGVGERFEAAANVTAQDAEAAGRARTEIIGRLDELLAPGTVLCLPTTPRAAPFLGEEPAEIETSYRKRAMKLLCPAGLAGLPQVNLPLARVGGAPVGLSLVGPRGSDLALLALAEELCEPVPAATLPKRRDN